MTTLNDWGKCLKISLSHYLHVISSSGSIVFPFEWYRLGKVHFKVGQPFRSQPLSHCSSFISWVERCCQNYLFSPSSNTPQSTVTSLQVTQILSHWTHHCLSHDNLFLLLSSWCDFFFPALSLFRYTYTKNLLCLLFWAWRSWSIYFINVGILLNLTKKRSVLFIICNNFYFSKLNRAILLGGNSHKYLLIYQTASKVRVLTFEFRSLHHWAHECGN